MTINSCSKLTAIVLAGGKSSRMGQDKALIPI
ncbi:molybdenum cofactor guanylyltransferase, partial [Nostoc sp. HG1]|nr:molybdenum cofactor guanylyltransferase [Nostoc sp. HG1]